MSDLCQKCGAAPRGLTHICPPLDRVWPSPGLSAFDGPSCPMCWRAGGSHALGCAVEKYILEMEALATGVVAE